MGFLDNVQKSLTKLKASDHLRGSGDVTLAPSEQPSEADYDEQYDPSNKQNAGGVSVETTNTYSKHVFEDPEIAKFYADLYEQSQYECRDHFDPKFYWEPKEERKLLRKLDWYVCFWAFIMFFALDVDRFNLANATTGTILKDLNLTTNDYNMGNTINLIFFLAAEIPSQLVSKKLGPDIWIPIQMVAWSLVAIFQAFMTNKAGFFVTRALIGMFEGGFIPDIGLWMSYFYTAPELAVRINYFYIANPLTSAVSSLFAYGLYHLEGHAGWKGWQWIFMIEGVVTLTIGIISFFKMPPSAVQTRAFWRPKGWFTHREEKIIVNKVLRDDPAKGDMHNREAITLKLIWKSVLDWQLWPVYISRLFIDILGSPLKTYLGIILKQGLHFSTLNSNLLMIPPQVGVIITMLSQGHIARWTKNIGFPLSVSALWFIPCLAALRWWPGFLVNQWGSYALMVVTLAAPPSWGLTIAWVGANSNCVRTRTISAALVNVASQLASIIGSQMFRKDDAPLYHRGTGQLFALAVTAFVVTVGARFFYKYLNYKRDKEWNALTREQQNDYTINTKDEGCKRLDFRFTY